MVYDEPEDCPIRVVQEGVQEQSVQVREESTETLNKRMIKWMFAAFTCIILCVGLSWSAVERVGGIPRQAADLVPILIALIGFLACVVKVELTYDKIVRGW